MDSAAMAHIENIFDSYYAALYADALLHNRMLVNHARKELSLDAFADLVLHTAHQCQLDTTQKEPTYEDHVIFNDAFYKAILNSVDALRELRSCVPERFLITNSKVANNLQNFEIGREEVLRVGKRGTLPVTVKATLGFADKNVTASHPLSEYDKIVHDSVCSLLDSGNILFTPDMVYRTMNGMTDSESVSPISNAKIIESLDKMRGIEITIDYAEHIRMMHPSYKKVTEASISEPMLMMQKVTVTAGGNTTIAYKLAAVPPVYRYSQNVGQIISVPLSLLNTKDVLRSSESVIVLRAYLIKRIELMKNKNNRITSDTILFSSIYNAIHITDDNPSARKLKLNARNQCLKMMDFFVEQGYIKEYIIKKTGATIVGLVVHLPDPDKEKALPPPDDEDDEDEYFWRKSRSKRARDDDDDE